MNLELHRFRGKKFLDNICYLFLSRKMDPITILPREIIQYIGMLDPTVAFKYRQLNKQYRELSNNEYWHMLLETKYFKEKFSSESNYCARALYLHLHPIEDLDKVANGDQVRRLIASGLSLTGESMEDDESLFDTVQEVLRQNILDGRLSVIRAILECSDDKGREMLGEDITTALEGRISSFSTLEQINIAKYLVLQYSGRCDVWNLLERVRTKLLTGADFWRELMEKRIGMVNISVMPLYLAASKDLESAHILLESSVQFPGISNDMTGPFPLSFDGAELFTRYGIRLFDDHDIENYLDGRANTSIGKIIAGCNVQFIESVIRDFNIRNPQGIAKWTKYLFAAVISSIYCNLSAIEIIISNYPKFLSEMSLRDIIRNCSGEIEKISNILGTVDVAILSYILKRGKELGIDIDTQSLADTLTYSNTTPEVFKYLVDIGVGKCYVWSLEKFMKDVMTMDHRDEILKISLESGLFDNISRNTIRAIFPTILIDYINRIASSSSKIRILSDRYGIIEDTSIERDFDIDLVCDVIKLLASKVNLNRIEKKGSALTSAIMLGSDKIVKTLLSVGANPVLKTPSIDYSPIILAAKNGNKEIFDLLLPYHSGYQKKDEKMKEMITQGNCYEALMEIISGANPSVVESFDKIMETLLNYGIYEIFLVKIIVWSNPGLATDQNLSRAIDLGNRSVVSALLRCHGIDASGRNRDGTSHYHLALYKIHQETNIQKKEIYKEVCRLVAYNLEGTVFDQEGNSSLMMAINLGSKELIDITIDDEDMYKANNEGLTPMKLAIYNRNTACVNVLMEGGYNPTREKDIREFSEQYGTKEITDTIFNYIPMPDDESDYESSDEY